MTWAHTAADTDGAKAAAKLMALGRLQHSKGEIEEVDGDRRDLSHISRPQCKDQDVDWLAELLLDDDLVLEDFEDEVCNSSSSTFGRLTARRLMQARAQHCIVCMEEKEHTFVPQHAGNNGQSVEGHRFCSDCWMDFLDHSLMHLPASKEATAIADLSCPLCRSRIYVPDMWGVDTDLPPSWIEHAAPVAAVLGSVAEAEDSTRIPESPAWVDESCFAQSDSLENCEEACLPLCRRVVTAAVQQSVQCLREVIGTASAATAMMSLNLELEL